MPFRLGWKARIDKGSTMKSSGKPPAWPTTGVFAIWSRLWWFEVGLAASMTGVHALCMLRVAFVYFQALLSEFKDSSFFDDLWYFRARTPHRGYLCTKHAFHHFAWMLWVTTWRQRLNLAVFRSRNPLLEEIRKHLVSRMEYYGAATMNDMPSIR